MRSHGTLQVEVSLGEKQLGQFGLFGIVALIVSMKVADKLKRVNRQFLEPLATARLMLGSVRNRRRARP